MQIHLSLGTSHMQVLDYKGCCLFPRQAASLVPWLPSGPVAECWSWLTIQAAHQSQLCMSVPNSTETSDRWLEIGHEGIFTPKKLANAKNQSLFFFFLENWFLNIYQHIAESTPSWLVLLESHCSARQSSCAGFNQLWPSFLSLLCLQESHLLSYQALWGL